MTVTRAESPLLDDIDRTADENGVSWLELGGEVLPIRFRRAGDAKVLIVYFHGAVNKNKRQVPVFTGLSTLFDKSAHQISISDPSMFKPFPITMSWYAGHEGFALQALLPEFVSKLATELAVERVIFFGSSGGGFAALYYSWHFQDSVAVVAVPQTDIFKYYPGYRDRYRRACWPSLDRNELLPNVICTNVCDLYRNEMRNSVIFLHSAGDRFHMMNHMTPFLSAISEHDNPRLVVECGFWGKMGHGGSVPRDVALSWAKAAVLAATTEPDDLLVTHHSLASVAAPGAPKKVRDERAQVHDPSSLETADLLRNYHLRQVKGA